MKSTRGRITLTFDDQFDGTLVEGLAVFEVSFGYDAANEAVEMTVSSQTGVGTDYGSSSFEEFRIFLRSGVCFSRRSMSDEMGESRSHRGVEPWQAETLWQFGGPAAREICLAGLDGPDERLLKGAGGTALPAAIRPTRGEVPLLPRMALLSNGSIYIGGRDPRSPVPLTLGHPAAGGVRLSGEWLLWSIYAPGETIAWGELGELPLYQVGTAHYAASWSAAPGLHVQPPDEFNQPLAPLVGPVVGDLTSTRYGAIADTADTGMIAFDFSPGAMPDLSEGDPVELDLAQWDEAEISAAATASASGPSAAVLEMVAIRGGGRSWPGVRHGAPVVKTLAGSIASIWTQDESSHIDIALDPPLPPEAGSSLPGFLSLERSLVKRAGLATGDLIAVYRNDRLGELRDSAVGGWIEWVERVRDGAILAGSRAWDEPVGHKFACDDVQIEDSGD